ncbi:MAG: co-chaperone DjlA [Gammaproteobacteria bacterium]|nr:co-chaperone DjlA [Gammaproteobacteria bacterium]MBU2056983.1 co-chaperone DjlA [Gammaproteobacteria bacterium]MBU2174485.1 co-chaperone DjlA [Gammaproteobacteria bacterium]MBU2248177.1 co-chaperone DjlA [Gammaproteobacteria bacterium]MBU2346459.1 co-chaperone DjlA [Gammaproteobacteria bacterium]
MWGKILGALFGMALLKIPGLFIGLVIGHWFDKSYGGVFASRGGFNGFSRDKSEAQGIFRYNTFAVMGHIAKSNGVVTKSHIQQATVFMDQLGLTAAQKQEAQAAFRDGKEPDFPLLEQLAEFRSVYRTRPDVLLMFLEIQISTAYVDLYLSSAEQKILTQVASALGINLMQFEQMLSRYEAEARFAKNSSNGPGDAASRLTDAYKILGISADSSEVQLKKAYKKLMAQHHPDKLMSQGLPPELMDVAKQKTQDIQAAYELIRKQRG